MWRFVRISGLQCFTSGTWIIIGGPIVCGISRRNVMDSTGDSSVHGMTVPHCSATDSATENVKYGYCAFHYNPIFY